MRCAPDGAPSYGARGARGARGRERRTGGPDRGNRRLGCSGEREPEAEDAARLGPAGLLAIGACGQPLVRYLASHLFLLAEDELEVLRALHVCRVSFPRPAGCLPVERSSPRSGGVETDGDAQSGGGTNATGLRQRRAAGYVR